MIKIDVDIKELEAKDLLIRVLLFMNNKEKVTTNIHKLGVRGNISKYAKIDTLPKYLRQADDKGIIKWHNRYDFTTISEPIKVSKGTTSDKALMLSKGKVRRILKLNIVTLTKANMLMLYATIVNELKERDTKTLQVDLPELMKLSGISSRNGIVALINQLEELELIKVIRYNVTMVNGKAVRSSNAYQVL